MTTTLGPSTSAVLARIPRSPACGWASCRASRRSWQSEAAHASCTDAPRLPRFWGKRAALRRVGRCILCEFARWRNRIGISTDAGRRAAWKTTLRSIIGESQWCRPLRPILTCSILLARFGDACRGRHATDRPVPATARKLTGCPRAWPRHVLPPSQRGGMINHAIMVIWLRPDGVQPGTVIHE